MAETKIGKQNVKKLNPIIKSYDGIPKGERRR
jgi:hypothetical protein